MLSSPLIPAEAGTQAFCVSEAEHSKRCGLSRRNEKNLGPRLRGDERNMGSAYGGKFGVAPAPAMTAWVAGGFELASFSTET